MAFNSARVRSEILSGLTDKRKQTNPFTKNERFEFQHAIKQQDTVSSLWKTWSEVNQFVFI